MNLPGEMVAFSTQSKSNLSILLFWGQNLEIETFCFKNPKLNPNNHCS